jgi:hypothetical protein
MRLIGLAVVLTLSLLLAPLAAEAQPAGTVPRIGVLSPSAPSDPRMQRRLEAFQQGLRELGYVEGQNIAFESRWAEGRYDRLPALAAELVRLKVNVIVTMAPPPTQAAKDATRTIPIVMGGVISGVRRAKAAGIHCGRPRKHELDPAEVLALHTQGLSLTEIGRRLGNGQPVHATIIRRTLQASQTLAS